MGECVLMRRAPELDDGAVDAVKRGGVLVELLLHLLKRELAALVLVGDARGAAELQHLVAQEGAVRPQPAEDAADFADIVREACARRGSGRGSAGLGSALSMGFRMLACVLVVLPNKDCFS